MPVLDIEPGGNPKAPGVLTFGIDGQTPGFQVTTAGVITSAGQAVTGDLAVSGDLTVGDDITVTDDVAVGGDLAVTGTIQSTGAIGASDAVNVTRAILGDNAVTTRATGDVQARTVLRSDAELRFGDGTANPDVNLKRAAADILGTDDDFAVTTVGKGLRVAEGANGRQGVATLVGGTVTVNNTSITASTRIFYAVQTAGGTQGFLRTTRVNGTSFTITSTSGTETSTVAWELFEPA